MTAMVFGLQKGGGDMWRESMCLLVIALGLQSCASTADQSKVSAMNAPQVNVVIAEGQAAIVQGKRLLAKQQAVQDAIRQASLQTGAMVRSQTQLNQGAISTDTVSLRAAARVNYTRILSEWELEGIYYVRAQVTLSNSDMCIPHYRKRIVATGFPLTETSQLSSSESQDLYGGIPREITNLLMETGDYLGVNATHVSLYAHPSLAPDLYDDDPYKISKVMQIAADNGAQFVLSGVIRDLRIESDEYIQGSGPSAMLKSLFQDVWSRRGIGIDVYLHDGFTGALLFQYRYVDNAAGDVWIPAGYTVGSERFKTTPSGEKIAQIIAKASADIRHSLSCYPFAARVNKVEKNQIYIDAGAQDQLSPGDQLVVYADASDDFKVDGARHYLEHDKHPAGVVTLTEVKPRYAIGNFEVDPQTQGIRPGDWVKSW